MGIDSIVRTVAELGLVAIVLRDMVRLRILRLNLLDLAARFSDQRRATGEAIEVLARSLAGTAHPAWSRLEEREEDLRALARLAHDSPHPPSLVDPREDEDELTERTASCPPSSGPSSIPPSIPPSGRDLPPSSREGSPPSGPMPRNALRPPSSEPLRLPRLRDTTPPPAPSPASQRRAGPRM